MLNFELNTYADSYGVFVLSNLGIYAIFYLV